MDKTRRTVKFLELTIERDVKAKTGEGWDLSDLVTRAKAHAFYARAVKEGARRTVRIKDLVVFVHQNRSFVAILFVLANADAMDATYENIQSGDTITHAKADGEGNRSEAHMIIDLTPIEKGGAKIYPAVLEECAGLSPSAIYPRLYTALGTAGEREIVADGERHVWRPMISLNGLFSHSMLEELASNKIDSFELVRQYEEPQGIDEDTHLEQKKLALHLSVQEQPNGAVEKMKALIFGAKKFAQQEHFETLRIHYRQNSDGRAHSTEIDMTSAGDESIVEKMVTRTATIVLENPLNHDHAEPELELSRLMATRLVQEAGG